MSVVAMPVPAKARGARQVTRPVLRLVPTGAGLGDGPLVDGPVVDGPVVDGAAIDDAVARSAREPVRRPGALHLTRRGRLARTLVAFAVVSLLISMALARVAAPGPLVADRAVVVEPGQTLTQIAYEQLPQRPVAEGVALLRELNKMSSSQVIAGQSVLIPAV